MRQRASLAYALEKAPPAVAQDASLGRDAQIAQGHLTGADRDLLVDHHPPPRCQPDGVAAGTGWAEVKKARLTTANVGGRGVVIDHPPRLVGGDRARDDERGGDSHKGER